MTAICSNADLVYANTVGTSLLLHETASLPRSILHLHEMRYALEALTHERAAAAGLTFPEYIARTTDLVDAIIVPSNKNREQLIAMTPRAVATCHVVPGMIDVASARSAERDPNSVRGDLGIPHAACVVVGAGGVEWRKGTDLFLQVAAQVVRSLPGTDVHFVWVGARWPADAYNPEQTKIEFDVTTAGLAGRVHVVPVTADPAAYLAAADLFLLPSREDPFPLVVLEAAALGKPAVCFETVGIADFVADSGGVTVPYLDTCGMSHAIRALVEQPDRRYAAGARAALRAQNYDHSVIAPRLFDLITATASGKPSWTA